MIDDEDLKTDNKPVRVLIADDQRLVREGIASLLSLQTVVEVVGTAANGQAAIELALQTGPDVILMDVRMPVMDGVSATAELRRLLPACRILMLTTFDEDTYILEALRAGASGYLLKVIPEDDLTQAIIAVHRGIYQLDPKAVASLTNPERFQAAPGPTPKQLDHEIAAARLTAREIEVLQLIGHGLTNTEIATTLVISEGTVKNHITSIFGRLGFRDRVQAVIYARENNLI